MKNMLPFLLFIISLSAAADKSFSSLVFQGFERIGKEVQGHPKLAIGLGVFSIGALLGIKYRKQIKKYFFGNDENKDFRSNKEKSNIEDREKKNNNQIKLNQSIEKNESGLEVLFASCRELFKNIPKEKKDDFLKNVVVNFDIYTNPLKIKKSFFSVIKKKSIENQNFIVLKKILNGEIKNKFEKSKYNNKKYFEIYFYYYLEFELLLFDYLLKKNSEEEDKKAVLEKKLSLICEKSKKLFESMNRLFFSKNLLLPILVESIFLDKTNLNSYFFFQLTSLIKAAQDTTYLENFYKFNDKERMLDLFQSKIEALDIRLNNKKEESFEKKFIEIGLDKKKVENILMSLNNSVRSEAVDLSKPIDSELISYQNGDEPQPSFFRSFYEVVVKYNNLKKIEQRSALSKKSRIRHFKLHKKKELEEIIVIPASGHSGEWTKSQENI